METKFSTTKNIKNTMIELTWIDIKNKLQEVLDKNPDLIDKKSYGVPRGGNYISAMLKYPVSKIEDADFIIDDIIDSGKTKERYSKYNIPFYSLYDKPSEWIIFPWENEEKPATDLITRIIEFIGDDPNREGLLETPNRVVRSWDKLFEGYKKDPVDIMKTFKDGKCDELVILKDIEFYSTCEHHMIPFFGKISIGYIPDGKVIGVSKLARLVEIYTRRLQIQERLVGNIADDIMKYLNAKGCMVICEAKHLCMVARGVEKQNSTMITNAIRGVFIENNVRNEFLSMIK